MRAIINLWRGLLLETYLTRYFELHPGLSRRELAAWIIPVAVARMTENIPGENNQLLDIIQAYCHYD
jgi:hypothetical protein